LWAALADDVRAHIVRDGEPVDGIDGTDDLATACSPSPPCLAARRRAVARAVPASVVVATRNRTESLATCLASLLAMEHPAFEIVVVDNAPADDATRSLVERVAR